MIHSIVVCFHRAPHLLCRRALEVQKYVCAPDASHLPPREMRGLFHWGGTLQTRTSMWFEAHRTLQPCERLSNFIEVIWLGLEISAEYFINAVDWKIVELTYRTYDLIINWHIY